MPGFPVIYSVDDKQMHWKKKSFSFCRCKQEHHMKERIYNKMNNRNLNNYLYFFTGFALAKWFSVSAELTRILVVNNLEWLAVFCFAACTFFLTTSMRKPNYS